MHSLTVRHKTANGRELASAKGLTADELVEELMEMAMGSWMACSLYTARIVARRMLEYTADVYLKLAEPEDRGRRNI